MTDNSIVSPSPLLCTSSVAVDGGGGGGGGGGVDLLVGGSGVVVVVAVVSVDDGGGGGSMDSGTAVGMFKSSYSASKSACRLLMGEPLSDLIALSNSPVVVRGSRIKVVSAVGEDE
jgi:hypothetical protein